MDQDIDSCLEVIKIVYEINAIHKKFSLDAGQRSAFEEKFRLQ